MIRANRIGALARTAAAWLPPGGRLVEVGFDRGAILCAVLELRPDVCAVGVEIQPGAKLELPPTAIGRAAVLIGNGFEPIDPTAHDAAHVALIAGLGGRTIAAILERDPARTRAFSALVLSPSHLEAEIRPCLARLGMSIADELLVTERGRFYEIIVAWNRASHSPTEHDLDPVIAAWGPRLFERHDPLLVPFLEDQRRRFSAAFAQGLRSYRSGSKAPLGEKLAGLDRALARAR